MQCLECHQEFQVSQEDQRILDALDLPSPQLCGVHSQQRKLAFRNERHLYRRNCELCGNSVLTHFSPESYQHMYCRDCWYGDTWDPKTYGKNYDPERSFMEQFFELMQSVPLYNAFWVGQRENSEYANFALGGKDVYMSFSTVESEGVLYSKNTDYSRDIVDSAQIIKSELLYDCVDTEGSYHSAWLTRCSNCSDCYLSRDLTDCQECFGSVNLKHKKYVWFNEQLTRDEYKRRLEEALRDRNTFQAQVDRFSQHQLNFPVEFANIKSSPGSVGHDIHNSSHIRQGFNVRESENLGDVFRVYKSKDVFRDNYGLAAELSYESSASPRRTKSIATLHCPDIFQVSYSIACENNQDLFGCIGLRKQRFCILNKQYTESEYHGLRQQIVEHMKQAGEWGEFFPVRCSPHAYNDTVAAEYWPLSEEEVQAHGWRWQSQRGGTRGKETIPQELVPQDISQVSDDILKEILACKTCGLNYKIQKKELEVLRDFRLPIPETCPECRFEQRRARTYVPQLFDRSCMCEQTHPEHSGRSCSEPILTIYAPDRPEKVYCKQCYAHELL